MIVSLTKALQDVNGRRFRFCAWVSTGHHGHAVERFLDVMSTAVRAAGDVARRMQGRIPRERKKGASAEAEALTAVDLACQDLLLRLLHREFPEVAVDAEEDTSTLDLFASDSNRRPVVVIDPLDGTASYCDGSDRYAVMVGWMEDGVFRAAMVHYPAWDLTLWSDGKKLYSEGRLPPRPRTCDVMVTPWAGASARRRLENAGLRVEISRCSAVDGAATVLGMADGSICDGNVDRRRAIPLFLSRVAGGLVDIGGRRWDGSDPARLKRGGKNLLSRDAEVRARLMDVLPS